jgi:hypothetical protein
LESSLSSGSLEGLEAASYWYDGDGNMVNSEINGVTIYYPGRYYNRKVDDLTETVRKYYNAGSNHLAMPENGTLVLDLPPGSLNVARFPVHTSNRSG